jgi:molybdenum cofactor biosynthesis enzyme MoaA
MKKSILFAFIMIFMLSASTFAAGKKNPENLTKTENKLSAEEMSRLTRRVEEIRDMDKTNMTAGEKSELRTELKGIKKNVRRDGGAIYIGTGTLILIIILVILLV